MAVKQKDFNFRKSDMEEQVPELVPEQVPELVDISDNEISSTRDNNRDNGQGPTTENERNENEKNENKNSRHTHRPIILMTNLTHAKEIILTFSDKLLRSN